MQEEPNPSGLCQCGCGGLAPLAPNSSTQRGWVKGQPLRFIHGHRAKVQKSLERRLLEKVLIGDGCWEWQAYRSKGYGLSNIGTKNVLAHRAFYEVFIGPVPDGKELHHTCGNKGCCNPSHLVPLTRKEHVVLDGRNKPKTACPQGHPYSSENTYTYPSGARACIICRHARERAHYAARERNR